MGNRFDELAKGLAGALTRRDALKCAGGFAGGTLLALLGLGRKASAQGPSKAACRIRCRALGGDELGECVKVCLACGSTAQVCHAVDDDEDNDDFFCCTGATACCNGNTCVPIGTDLNCNPCNTCARGTHCCNGTCVVENTTANCGACNTNCVTDCCGGGGTGVAPVSFACCPTATPNCCSGHCKNLQTDPANCRTCGNACPTADPCCTAGTCSALGTTTNCASCGNACGVNQGCCAVPSPGTGVQCTSLTTTLNCGTCTNACPTTEGTNFQCCPDSSAPGGFACKDLFRDSCNCNACGSICPASTFCNGGLCMCSAASTCPVSGQHACGNGCLCALTAGGEQRCVQPVVCPSFSNCTLDSDCATGSVCITQSCCTGSVCHPLCAPGSVCNAGTPSVAARKGVSRTAATVRKLRRGQVGSFGGVYQSKAAAARSAAKPQKPTPPPKPLPGIKPAINPSGPRRR